ncbi:MAG TPA: hypothetical protein VF887_04130 [Gemmatimonadaceae bacterium]
MTATFDRVQKLGLKLSGVVVDTYFGKPALKLDGQMLACMASHKSAEPNTLVVRIDFFERDLRVANEPDIYYLKPHYVDYACVLTRLSRIDDAALRDLLDSGWRFINKKKKAKKTKAARPRRPRS